MKFGKSLSNQIEETLPEWRDKFLSYKELKKKLKLIEPKGNGERSNKRLRFQGGESCDSGWLAAECTGSGEGITMSREELEFIKLLDAELEKFNTFFEEKEEEYVIRQKELQDRVARAKDCYEEMIVVRKEIVDFHGEMVLLENYSALNYTGLVKILKKYDKRTGALIRLPFIQRVLRQPFFTTDLLFKLVKECETMMDHLFPANRPSVSGDEGYQPESDTKKDRESRSKGPSGLEEIKYMESLYMKSTMSALRVLKEIRSGSSTYSVFSLPPLQSIGLEESWSKISTREEIKVAK